MTTTDFPELNPETEAIMAALLDSALDDMTHVAVSEDAIARYACGWVTPEESDAVVAALTTSSTFRARLLEMKADIRSAEQGPTERAQVFSRDSHLAEAMTSAFVSSMKLLSRWSQAWATREPQNLTIEDKRSLYSLLANLGTRMQANTMQPAFARSGRPPAKVVVEPGNVSADLAVRVEEDDSIHAQATFSKPYEEPKEVSLYVVEGGGEWTWIGSNVAKGSVWSLKTPQYASMLGLGEGDLASQSFAMSEGRGFMSRGWVGLDISEDLQARGAALPTRLRLKKPPMIVSGNLVISFEMPESLQNAYANENLTLAIVVGSASYVLGSWKISELRAMPEVELRAPAASMEDCAFESHSAIRLMIRPAS